MQYQYAKQRQLKVPLQISIGGISTSKRLFKPSLSLIFIVCTTFFSYNNQVNPMLKNFEENISKNQQLFTSMASTSQSIRSDPKEVSIGNKQTVIQSPQSQNAQEPETYELYVKVMNWFKEHQIGLGSLNDLVSDLRCSNLKKVTSLEEKPIIENSCLIKRRLQRNLPQNV